MNNHLTKADSVSPGKDNPAKRTLTFGDFVAGVYKTWGQQRGQGIVQLALKMHVIEFRGTKRFVFS